MLGVPRTEKPMELTAATHPSGNFTKVPNDLIFHPVWQANRAAALYHVWCMMAAIAPRKGITSLKHLANILALRLDSKYSWETLKKHFAKMIHLGLLAKTEQGWELRLPETVEKLPKPSEKKPKPVEKEIIEELREEPARTRCEMSTNDRWEVIRSTWNTYKPDNFQALKEKKDGLLFAALETHTRHLKIDRTQYGAFIKTVCAALKDSDWWTKKPGMTARNVFGMTVELEDRKLQSVQRLYAEAKSNTSGFDHRNDAQVRKWYKKAMPEKKHEFINKSVIHRIEVEEGPMIPAIESYCRIEIHGENGGVLHPEDEELLKKIKINPAWYTGTVEDCTIPIRMYYVKGNPDPTNWTYRHDYTLLHNLPSAPIK